MTTNYQRSAILNYAELSDAQQTNASDMLGIDLATETAYVILGTDALPLCMFLKAKNSKVWSGIYSTSYFDGYYIKLAQNGQSAVVARRHF